MRPLSEKEEALKEDRNAIIWLESLITSEDPTSCRITVSIEKERKKYAIPKGAYLRDHPDAVKEVMDFITRYKNAYGSEETKKQLDNAPVLYSELIIAGKGKELEYILNNNAA